jgi:hypothetical protein
MGILNDFSRRSQRRFSVGDDVWCIKHVPRLPHDRFGKVVKHQTEMLDHLVIIDNKKLSTGYTARRDDGAIQEIFDRELTNVQPIYSVGDEVETETGDRGTIDRIIQFHEDRSDWVYSVRQEGNISIGYFGSMLKPSIVSLAPSTDDLEKWYREGKKRAQNGLENYKRTVEWVPVETMKRYMHVDRTAPDMSHYTEEDWAALKQSLEQGWTEPLMILYYSKDRTAVLGEGNHRLAAAIQLGMDSVPVRVWRMSMAGSESSYADNVVPVPGMTPNKHGYVPADLKPSDIGLI